MLDSIETLMALSKYKTMVKTATSLRVTQSAISKRIKNLEDIVGKKLIIQNGRNIELTKAAIKFLETARPHLIGLKEAVNQTVELSRLNIRIGFSESILSSWGTRALANINHRMGEKYSVIPHVHRGPMVIDRVISSEYILGLCAGTADNRPGISKVLVGKERMVLIKKKGVRDLPIMSIEPTSETWSSIRQEAVKEKIVPNQWIEFFSPIVQLAANGVVEGFVPIGIAKSMHFKNMIIKKTKIYRPISLITQKSTLHREDLAELIQAFSKQIKLELNSINKLS